MRYQINYIRWMDSYTHNIIVYGQNVFFCMKLTLVLCKYSLKMYAHILYKERGIGYVGWNMITTYIISIM